MKRKDTRSFLSRDAEPPKLFHVLIPGFVLPSVNLLALHFAGFPFTWLGVGFFQRTVALCVGSHHVARGRPFPPLLVFTRPELHWCVPAVIVPLLRVALLFLFYLVLKPRREDRGLPHNKTPRCNTIATANVDGSLPELARTRLGNAQHRVGRFARMAISAAGAFVLPNRRHIDVKRVNYILGLSFLLWLPVGVPHFSNCYNSLLFHNQSDHSWGNAASIHHETPARLLVATAPYINIVVPRAHFTAATATVLLLFLGLAASASLAASATSYDLCARQPSANLLNAEDYPPTSPSSSSPSSSPSSSSCSSSSSFFSSYSSPFPSKMMSLQSGLLLLAGAGTACYTTFGLGLKPLGLDDAITPPGAVQILISLIPVVVVGAAGGIAAAAIVWLPAVTSSASAARWPTSRIVLWLQASAALYPAMKTVLSVTMAFAMASPADLIAAGDSPGTRHRETYTYIFLQAEHRHLATHEASYFATHLMILPPLVVAQLMLRVRGGAIPLLVAFSATHFWIASDNHADVSDETVAAGLAAHIVMLLLALSPWLWAAVVSMVGAIRGGRSWPFAHIATLLLGRVACCKRARAVGGGFKTHSTARDL